MKRSRHQMGAYRGYAKYTAPGHKPELKFKDTTQALTSVDDGGTIVDASALCLVATGNTENARHGRKISLQRIHINGFCQVNDFADTASSNIETNYWFRIVLLVDHQTNGAAAAIANIYEDTDILSHRNLENSARFTVLKEKWVQVRPTIVADEGFVNDIAAFSTRSRFSINLKCNIPIEYNAGTGAITERPCNNLVVAAFVTNDNATHADRCQVRYQARVRFYDY